MAVDPHCIVERFYIFKHKPVCMAVIYDMEPVDTFSLDQGMGAFYGTHRLSPVDVTSLYAMTGSPIPWQCITASHGAATHVAFPYFYQVSLPDSTHFSIQSFALSPCCLRLAATVTSIHPRLATNDAATPYWAGFSPAKCYTLRWAHGSLSNIRHTSGDTS